MTGMYRGGLADIGSMFLTCMYDRLDEECGNMAREGLRTLVVAKKRLSVDIYEEFRTK